MRPLLYATHLYLMANYLHFLQIIRAASSKIQLSTILLDTVRAAHLCTAVEILALSPDKPKPLILASYNPNSTQALKTRSFRDHEDQPYLCIKYALTDEADKKARRLFRLLVAAFELKYQSLRQQKIANNAQLKNQHYEKLLDAINDGIIFTDLKGVVSYVNKSATILLKGVAVGLNLKDLSRKILTQESDVVFTDNFKSRAKGISTTYQITTIDDNNNTHILSVRGVPVCDSNNIPVAVVAVVRDITTEIGIKRDLEISRTVAEKARSAERLFLANMSHEIRTPINAVIGMTHLLIETELSEEQLDYLNAIKFSADTLLNLISNILDISKIEAGELQLDLQQFSLNKLLLNLQQFYQQQIRTQKSISIIICHDEKIQCEIIGDPMRLQQIIANLLTNACKFTESGTIGINVCLLRQTDTHYTIQISILDTGIGIAQEHLAHIFDNFKQATHDTQRNFGGTGLGLPIVKNLVEIQNGSIEVSSSIGKGSIFAITLPFQKTDTPEIPLEILLSQLQSAISTKNNPKNKPQDNHQLVGLRILVAEDNLLNQKLLAKLLENWGCITHFAQNGQIALSYLRENVCDIILMDVHMPILDGCQTTLQIRAMQGNPNQNVPIIALTAAALLEERQRAFDVGMNEFLTKPFAPDQLQKILLNYNQHRNTNIHTPAVFSLDLSYLINLSNNDINFIAEILESFLQDSPSEIQLLQHFLTDNQAHEAAELLHKMQSTYALVGLKKISLQAQAIEKKLVNKTNIDTDSKAAIIEIIEAVPLYYALFHQWLTDNKI
jgi:PAS domain S-box-containing protein